MERLSLPPTPWCLLFSVTNKTVLPVLTGRSVLSLSVHQSISTFMYPGMIPRNSTCSGQSSMSSGIAAYIVTAVTPASIRVTRPNKSGIACPRSLTLQRQYLLQGSQYRRKLPDYRTVKKFSHWYSRLFFSFLCLMMFIVICIVIFICMGNTQGLIKWRSLGSGCIKWSTVFHMNCLWDKDYHLCVVTSFFNPGHNLFFFSF